MALECRTCSIGLLVHRQLKTCYAPSPCAPCALFTCHDTRCVIPLIETKLQLWQHQKTLWGDHMIPMDDLVFIETSVDEDDALDAMIPTFDESASNNHRIQHQGAQLGVLDEEVHATQEIGFRELDVHNCSACVCERGE